MLSRIGTVAAVFACSSAGVGATEGARQMKDEKITQVETMWASGLSAENLSSTQTIVRDILSEDDPNRTQGARLLEKLLMEKSPSVGMGDEDIILMETIALHMISERGVSREAAERNSIVSAKLLGRLRQEIIPNFSRLPVPANIGPPAGVPGFAGMSSDAIGDPAVRAQYEGAIQDNLRKNRTNRRQHTLAKVERTMSKLVRDYLVAMTREAKISQSHLACCMAEARMDSTERTEIMDHLRRDGG